MIDCVHQIRRQRYELQLADAELRAPAEVVLRQGRAEIERALLAVLEQLDRPGQMVRLGRVELDLGVVSSAELRPALRQRLPRLLHQQLQQRIAALASAVACHSAEPAPELLVGGDRISAVAGNALQALLAYLATGQRPWWARNLKWRQLLAELAATGGPPGQSSHSGALVVSIWQSLERPDHSVLARMAGPGAWPALVAHVPVQLLQELEQTSVGIDGEAGAGRLLALAVVLVGSGERVAEMAAMLSASLGGERLRRWRSATGADAALPPAAQALLQQAMNERPGSQAAAQPLLAVTAGWQPGGAEASPRLKADGSGAAAIGVANGIDSPPEVALPADVTLLTPVAGLVLLHPFLPALLQELGLLVPDQSGFVAGGQRRAVALLHYLAWGDGGSETPAEQSVAADGVVQPDEPELVLEKLLVGLSPSLPWWPLPLTEAERAEAGQVLAAVVSHWQALKSTSAAGLRQGFMQRDGQLHQGTGGWRLRVARQDIDVLMERLPWSFNVVRLAWMPQPLMVDW